jgi:cell wall-associated NlpC family hydrolase
MIHIKPCTRGALFYERILRFMKNKTTYAIIGFIVVNILIEGCGGSSPRFADHGKKGSSTEKTIKHGPRFSSKEAEEEAKENDKKLDPKEVERIKSGERDFRKEKNEAIKPLDHSKMMREISKYMGVSYVLGGASIDGMDCSGYTMTVYKNALGKQLPRTSSEQSKLGISIRLSDLKFGDLVFFATTGESASHVGIYLVDDLFAHASVSLGVTISSLQSSYFAKRYESARRVID